MLLPTHDELSNLLLKLDSPEVQPWCPVVQSLVLTHSLLLPIVSSRSELNTATALIAYPCYTRESLG